MSRYEWEKGSFTIPSSQWAGLKKQIRDRHNELVEKDLALAKEIVAMTRLMGKGKRGVDWRNLLERVYYESFARNGRELSTIGCWKLAKMVVSEKSGKLVEPKKGEFPWANNTTKSFSNDDADLSFDDKTRTVRWYVSENNHAVDTARESYLGVAFFNALDRIQWTRGSGGHIIGNDEYNSDSDYVGGGGNYIKDFKGPLGEAAYERYTGISAASLRRPRMRY